MDQCMCRQKNYSFRITLKNIGDNDTYSISNYSMIDNLQIREKWIVLIQEILRSIYFKYRTRIYYIRHTISIRNILFYTKLATSVSFLQFNY